MGIVVAGFYDLPRHIIDFVQSGTLPYERIINPQLYQVGAGLGSNMPASPSPTMSVHKILGHFLKWMAPTLFILGLILILAIAIPITGCWYACLRKRGGCLAGKYRRILPNHGAKFFTTLLFMLIFNVLLIAGISLGFISNAQLSSALLNLPHKIGLSLQNGLTFVNSTADEVIFLTEDRLMIVLDTIDADLTDIGTLLGNPIVNRLTALYPPLDSDISAFISYLDDAYTDIYFPVNESLSGLVDHAVQLETLFIGIQATLDNFTIACASDALCEAAVPSTDWIGTELEELLEMSMVNPFTDTDLDEVQDDLLFASQRLTSLSGLIVDNFNDTEVQLNTLSIHNPFNSTLKAVKQLLNNQDLVNFEYLNVAETYLHQYEMYRKSAGHALFAIFLVMLCFYLCGTITGLVGYRRKTRPHLRTSLSNAGARIISCGIGVSFSICGLLTLSTTLLYLLSTLSQKVCNDFSPPNYVFFKNTIDNQDLWNGDTFGTFALAGLFEGELEINITDILSRCADNETLYKALKVNRIFDLPSVIASISESNILGDLVLEDVVDQATKEVLTEATLLQIEELPQSLVNATDEFILDNTLDEIDLRPNLNDLVADLNQLALVFDSMNKTDLTSQVYSVRDYVLSTQITGVIEALENETDDFRELLSDLNTTSTTVNLTETVSTLKTQAIDIVSEEFEEYYTELMAPVLEYLRYFQDAIENKIGSCEPIVATYRGIHSAMCIEVLNGMNGIWCSTLWCVCAVLLLIANGTMVIVFFKRADEIDGYGYGDNALRGKQSSVISPNSVQPCAYNKPPAYDHFQSTYAIHRHH